MKTLIQRMKTLTCTASDVAVPPSSNSCPY